MVRISVRESHFGSSNWSRLPAIFSPLVNFPNNVCGSFTAIATTRFFRRWGRYDFACIHCTFRSRKRKFTNRMQAFLTSASLILAFYVFQQNVRQAISKTRSKCSHLTSFQHWTCNAIFFLSFAHCFLDSTNDEGFIFQNIQTTPPTPSPKKHTLQMHCKRTRFVQHKTLLIFHECVRRSGGIIPRILKPGTRFSRAVSFTTALTSPKHPPVL